MDLLTIGGILIVAALCVVAYMVFGDDLRRAAQRRADRRQQFGEEYSRFKDTDNNPFIPDFIEKNPARGLGIVLLILLLFVTATNCVHSVPPGHRGVVVTLGKVSQVNLGEGLQFKLPYIQKIVNMKVTLEKEEVQESAASSDLQEIMTTLTVHFNVMPDCAWKMYQNMRKDYHSLLLKPIIQEDLKATTAQFTAEQLITTRSQLVYKLTEKLDTSLEPYGINVQTVNFVNFEFTEVFMDAVEAKVTAEQEALKAKNVLVQIQYEAQQKIIQAEAEKNATIITAEAQARQVEISADAEAYKVMIEANATAEAIMLITNQMTPEYAHYLYLMRWSGDFPTTMLGDIEDLGLLITPTP